MKTNKLLIIVMLAITSIITSCELAKDEEGDGKGSSTSTFVNKLTFGSAVDPQTQALTGISKKFPSTADTIFFRLESKDDQVGSNVRLKIKNANNNVSIKDYTAVQINGHLFKSSFASPKIVGAYSIDAYLVKEATETLVISDSLIIE